MVKTTKEKLAKAEFWAMTAMNAYDSSEAPYDALRQAYELIKKAGELEEDVAWQRTLRAAQLA